MLRGRFAEAERHIEAHRVDPAPSAARAAAALRMSERSLYALFARHGMRVAARVRQRRRQESRAARLAHPTRPVIDVALVWGFGGMPSFYRAFQAAFGLSPGDLRDAVLNGALGDPGRAVAQAILRMSAGAARKARISALRIGRLIK